MLRKLLNAGAATLAVIAGCGYASAQTLPTGWKRLAGLPGAAPLTMVFKAGAPATALLGSEAGRVLRTTDAGQHWTSVTVGAPSTYFGALAYGAGSRVYACGSDFSVDATITTNFFTSADDGATWAPLAPPAGEGSVANVVSCRGVVVSGQTLVVADRRNGFLRSTDGGKTWATVLAGRPYSLIRSPTSPSVLYAVGGNGFRFWKSQDFGATWTASSVTNLPTTLQSGYRVAVQPKSGSIIASWYGQDPISFATIGGIVVSDDGGATFSPASGLPPNFAPSGSADWLVFNPVNPDQMLTVYTPDQGPGTLLQSNDGGKTWAIAAGRIAGALPASLLKWRPAAASLPARLYAGGADLLSAQGFAGVLALDTSAPSVGAALQVLDDPARPTGVYALTGSGAFSSDNGGGSWRRISTWAGAQAARSLVVGQPGTSHPVYVVTVDARILRSTDGGNTWTRLLPPLVANERIGAVFADPRIANRIYVTTVNTMGSPVGKRLLISANSGASWRAITFSDSISWREFAATNSTGGPLVLGSNNSASDGLLVSKNRGLTWASAAARPGGGGSTSIAATQAGTPTIVTAALDPVRSGFAFYSTTDAGASWTRRSGLDAVAEAAAGLAPYVGSVPGRNLISVAIPAAAYSFQRFCYLSPDGGATLRDACAALPASVTSVVGFTQLPSSRNFYVSNGAGDLLSASYSAALPATGVR